MTGPLDVEISLLSLSAKQEQAMADALQRRFAMSKKGHWGRIRAAAHQAKASELRRAVKRLKKDAAAMAWRRPL